MGGLSGAGMGRLWAQVFFAVLHIYRGTAYNVGGIRPVAQGRAGFAGCPQADVRFKNAVRATMRHHGYLLAGVRGSG